MANPNIELWLSTGTTGISAINFGTGDAGTYLPGATGVPYRLWNDKDLLLGSTAATNLKVRVRDSTGTDTDVVTAQQWLEVKSTTIAAGTGGGSIVGYTNDNMSEFQPIGGDTYLTLGNMPADTYRNLLFRINVPPGAQLSAETFNLYFDYNDPSAALAVGINDIHGNGVLPIGNKLAVTDSTGADSIVTIASGYAHINDNEISLSGLNKTLSTADNTYYVYVTQDGVVSYISSSTDFPTSALKLAEVTISSGKVSSVTDKRIFIGNVRAGLSAAKTTGPDIGQNFLATDEQKLYNCFTSGSWTNIPIDNWGTQTTGVGLNATTDRHGLLRALSGSTDAYLRADGTWVTPPSGSGGSTSFLALSDTPANYSSAASYIVRVNSSSDGLEFVSTTGIALDAFGISSTGVTLNASTDRHGLLPVLSGSTDQYLKGNGTWSVLPGSTGGEVNTASNAGTTGTGIFWQKNGVDLEFKSISSTGKITVTDTTDFATVRLDVDAVVSSGGFSLNYIPKVASSGDKTITNSPFKVTTGDVFDFGAHSAGFTEQTIATTTGTAAIDWNAGNKALYTRSSEAGGAITFTFTTPVKSTNLQLTIKGSTMGSTGTVTLPKIYWANGTVPVFTTGVNDINIIAMYYSTGLASYLGQGSSGSYSTV